MTSPLICSVGSAPPPESLFPAVESRPFALWLDSALVHPEVGRYSFIATDPFLVLRGRDGRSEWIDRSGASAGRRDPLSELGEALLRFRLAPTSDLPPFSGGAAGYLGYELARDLERLPRPRAADLDAPDLELGFYDLVIGWDHVRSRCWIASTGFPETGAEREQRARRRLEEARLWLAGGPPPEPDRLAAWSTAKRSDVASRTSARSRRGPRLHPVPEAPQLRSSFSREAYAATVRKAVELIRAGDVFQVNLSQRFEGPGPARPFSLYQSLRRDNPAPFAAFYRGSRCTILSASPERFFRLSRDGRAEARPIKGTRPRGSSAEADVAMARELLESDKDRAENLMIVDLVRNDLSRVCRPGSVGATDLFRLESFATVHHLVSTVTGTMKNGLGALDLLRAAFPCGSVTGAPKIRAMEIISALEPVARGPYCGAIGYVGFGGDADASVAIRILVSAAKRCLIHAGGAVVADSDPLREYEETLAKARALIEAHAGAA